MPQVGLELGRDLSRGGRAVCPKLLRYGALLGLLGFATCPASAERPDVVWMAGGHQQAVRSVAVSPDGQIIASGGDDFTVKLWRASDGALLHTMAAGLGYVRSVAFSPDGLTVASGSQSGASGDG